MEGSDLEPELYMVVSKGKASLLELDRDYNTSDVYDLLEIIEIENDLEYASNLDQEAQQKQAGNT